MLGLSPDTSSCDSPDLGPAPSVALPAFFLDPPQEVTPDETREVSEHSVAVKQEATADIWDSTEISEVDLENALMAELADIAECKPSRKRLRKEVSSAKTEKWGFEESLVWDDCTSLFDALVARSADSEEVTRSALLPDWTVLQSAARLGFNRASDLLPALDFSSAADALRNLGGRTAGRSVPIRLERVGKGRGRTRRSE